MVTDAWKQGLLRRALARIFNRLRRESGLSQEELARRAGLHRTYMGLVERAERTPSLDALLRLLTVLGVSFEVFGSHLDAELRILGLATTSEVEEATEMASSEDRREPAGEPRPTGRQTPRGRTLTGDRSES